MVSGDTAKARIKVTGGNPSEGIEKIVEIGGHEVLIRPARRDDADAITRLDEETTGLRKPEYWDDLFTRYANRRDQRFFLVAEEGGVILGCILGEVRAWEFNSVPCGWVVTVSVQPGLRMGGIGTVLFDAMCACFKQAGVNRVRTMIPRDATDLMSFFRAQGMMAGPFIQLETDLT